jgi:predicted MFS family arabinose efflux permease
MLAIGALFMVTAFQSVLLALRAPLFSIAAAAVLAGFAFSYGTVVWDTSLQRHIAPEKLSRVSAYNWMGAMAFLPAGYALAGPVAQAIGIATYLWIGAVWVVLSTVLVLCVRDVRDFRGDEPLEAPVAIPA